MDSKTLLAFLNRPPQLVARELLGARLYTRTADGQRVGGIICEVEAYLKSDDAAAHNSRGKTKATQSLFAGPGTLYIHQMRQHILIDIVTDAPGSVLLRALEPTDGIAVMAQRRGLDDVYALCRGPGNLCKALGIDRSFDGKSLLDATAPLMLEVDTDNHVPAECITSNRVGITKNADAPLRYSIKESKFVSK